MAGAAHRGEGIVLSPRDALARVEAFWEWTVALGRGGLACGASQRQLDKQVESQVERQLDTQVDMQLEMQDSSGTPCRIPNLPVSRTGRRCGAQRGACFSGPAPREFWGTYE
ncbi:hypothetical protein AGIG_G25349 [Arapaima gigas]